MQITFSASTLIIYLPAQNETLTYKSNLLSALSDLTCLSILVPLQDTFLFTTFRTCRMHSQLYDSSPLIPRHRSGRDA